MCEAVGHPVRRLHRPEYAGLRVDELAPGAWRELAPSEVAALRAATAASPWAPRAPRPARSGARSIRCRAPARAWRRARRAARTRRVAPRASARRRRPAVTRLEAREAPVGRGVERSFPARRLNVRNSSVMTAQTVWLPVSSSQVAQDPSRKKPVSGSVEQGRSSPPTTLTSGSRSTARAPAAGRRRSCGLPRSGRTPSDRASSRASARTPRVPSPPRARGAAGARAGRSAALVARLDRLEELDDRLADVLLEPGRSPGRRSAPRSPRGSPVATDMISIRFEMPGLSAPRAHLRAGVGHRRLELLAHDVGLVEQPHGPLRRPAGRGHLPLGLLESMIRPPTSRRDHLRQDERLAVARVEPLGDVAGELDVLALVLADGHASVW